MIQNKNLFVAFLVAALIGLLILFGIVLYRNAWLGDDAYITFRTVDNFVNGYGLTWNTGERVQAYTNPLWMFLLSPVYALTNEIYYTSLIVSIITSMLAVTIFGFTVSRTLWASIISIVILSLSKSFMDYAASGMENPLIFLLIAIFFYVYFRKTFSLQNLALLSFIAALSAVTRLDTILLFLPPLLYAYICSRLRKKGILAVIIGGLPLILWLFFATFYYGFPFPNTAYAKLNTGINSIALWKQGIHYVCNVFKLDPLTPAIILLGLFSLFFTKERKSFPIAFSILLYIFYTVKIGGDFMSGRFFAAPFFCAVIIISRSYLLSRKGICLAFVCFVAIMGFSNPYNPVKTDENYSNREFDHGIADEKGFYFSTTSLLRARGRDIKSRLPRLKKIIAGFDLQGEEPQVIIRDNIGIVGYYTGPKIHIVDRLALGDALLARMHIPKGGPWRIGHFRRRVPQGYLESIETGRNLFHDKKLGRYYEKLSIIIKGCIWDPKRFLEIWKMNTGQYDHLLPHNQIEKNHID
jgi:arabinofuranosyltransferase